MSDLGGGLMEPLRVMDLFAGCGGFAEGFRTYGAQELQGQSAFRTVAAVDIDRAALATFEANHHPASPLCLDIRDFESSSFAGQVDVITGGPPCQGFSALGKGNPHDPRNELWEDYTRIVSEVQPAVFVMENVDRFLKSPEYARLLEAVAPGGDLQDYTLETSLLNAADYGVPQARRRAVAIGTHRSVSAPVGLPTPTHAKDPQPLGGLALFEVEPPLDRWLPVDAIFDRSSQIQIRGTELPQHINRDGIPGPFHTSDLHFGRTPTALSVARYRAIPPGGNRRDLSGKTAIIEGREQYLSTLAWDTHLSGSADVMGRLRLGVPSVTIRTEFFKPEKGRYLHPIEDRPITHYEAALLQGFPETYLWHGTKSEIARQIGNAVPVGLARAIVGAIHDQLTVSTGDFTR
ncbi:DNA cytosine methyltransferase [Streptomyces sp. NPDC093509]|uniref:DNA cytosine methyltransferase n=1 Tax=Streptomyces sp. NPDC093509 TaxID=3154982 RepID=UPI00344BF264